MTPTTVWSSPSRRMRRPDDRTVAGVAARPQARTTGWPTCGPPGVLLFGGEVPPEHRVYAEEREEVRGHRRDVDTLGVAPFGRAQGAGRADESRPGAGREDSKSGCAAGSRGSLQARRPAATGCRRRDRPRCSRAVSGSRYGNGLINTPCTTLKMADVAPMPRPSVTTATAVNPGVRASVRTRVPQVLQQHRQRASSFRPALRLSWLRIALSTRK